MVNIMINETNCSPIILPQKLSTHLIQDIEEFPTFLMNDELIMHGHLAEVDPRNYSSKSSMDVFLYDEFIVFTVCIKEPNGRSYKKTDSYYKLTEVQFFFHENFILSMEGSSGQSLLSDGSSIRLFRLPESTCTDWIRKLRKCEVRVEMKSVLLTEHVTELPDVQEGQEINFNNSPKLRKMKDKPLGDYKNKPIGDCRPRSYSHDPEPYSPSHHVPDLSFNMAIEHTSDDSMTTEASYQCNDHRGKRPLHRSLSVDNTARYCTNNNQTSHSLPSKLQTNKPKKRSNNKILQTLVRKLTKNGRDTDTSSILCRHIGTRFAQPSPQLTCKAESNHHRDSNRSEESMVSILTLKPQQIAQELTRHQAVMLQAVSPLELQRGAWTCKAKHEKAPNVVRLIEFNNHLIQCLFGKWILHEPNVEKRAKVIKRLIMVADECKILNNFECIHTIIQCLTMNCIARLDETWALLHGTSKMKTFTVLCSLVHTRFRWKNYRVALEVAKKKGFFIPIIPQFLNYLDHSNMFYKDQDVEKLVYIQEDDYSWTELSNSGSRPEKLSQNSKGSFKWLRSKSLYVPPSPLRSHIESKLRENVQSIVEQTSSARSNENTILTLEETPLYLLRLYQQHSAQYSLPASPIVANFLRLPFNFCPNDADDRKWPETWSNMLRLSEKLEPRTNH